MGIFSSAREREDRDREDAANKSGKDSDDFKTCPDCNGGYRGGFKCRTCDGEGAVEK